MKDRNLYFLYFIDDSDLLFFMIGFYILKIFNEFKMIIFR